MQPAYIHTFPDRAALRMWLRLHHDTEKECWVACSRTAKIPAGCLYYLDVVEEALCFGWIDSTCKQHNGIPIQRLTPRRKKSQWTELNKERCRRLEVLGLMTEAGRCTLLDTDADSFHIDAEILQALQADPIVWQNFQTFHPLYQRVRIGNIQLKRGTPLYQQRLHKLIRYTRQGILFGEWNDKGRLLNYNTYHS